MITYYRIIGRKVNEIFGNEFENYCGMEFKIEDIEVCPEDDYIDFTLTFSDSCVYFRLDTETDNLYIDSGGETYEHANKVDLYRELYYNK